MADADWKLALMVLDRFADDDREEVDGLLEGVAARRLKRVVEAMAAVACMCIEDLANAQGAAFDDVLDSIVELSAEYFNEPDPQD